MTREMQIAVERAAQAAQTDPLVEALNLCRCVVVWYDTDYGSSKTRAAVLEMIVTQAEAILSQYAPDREGGAE